MLREAAIVAMLECCLKYSLGAITESELKECFWKVDVHHLQAAMCTTKYAAQCKSKLAATYSTTAAPSAPVTTSAAAAAAIPAKTAPALNDVQAAVADLEARWDKELFKMVR